MMAPLKITLTVEELKKIKEITRKEVRSTQIVIRCLILKFRHLNTSTDDICDLLDVSSKTVTNTLNNFLELGLDRAIEDDYRSGRPIEFDDRDKANIIAMVCTDPPEGYARWTIDLITDQSVKNGHVKSISKSKIRIILQEHEFKPWREKMWCVPNLNEEYIERMENILEVYESAYDEKKPVVCVDEKPVALIGDKHERERAKPGKVGLKDYEYSRNGSAKVFCAVEPLKGKYINRVTGNRKSPEFAKFINDLSRKYSTVDKIILIMDNLNTHKIKSLIDYYGEEKAKEVWNRFEIHYTPKHASWLNQAEIAIGMYSRQCLGDGRVGTIENLKKKTKAWNKSTNKKETKIQWKFNREKARGKFNYEIGKN
jgi:transposase